MQLICGMYFCSIEDAKQKSEYEKMLMLAEKKKESIRQTLEQMKELYKELHNRNGNLPPYLKLNKKARTSDFDIVSRFSFFPLINIPDFDLALYSCINLLFTGHW